MSQLIIGSSLILISFSAFAYSRMIQKRQPFQLPLLLFFVNTYYKLINIVLSIIFIIGLIFLLYFSFWIPLFVLLLSYLIFNFIFSIKNSLPSKAVQIMSLYKTGKLLEPNRNEQELFEITTLAYFQKLHWDEDFIKDNYERVFTSNKIFHITQLVSQIFKVEFPKLSFKEPDFIRNVIRNSSIQVFKEFPENIFY